MTSVIEGCIDESACNYDETATTDDGTCVSANDCGFCGYDFLDSDSDGLKIMDTLGKSYS